MEKHFLSSKRLGGEHVLQQYLNPHLLRDKHKYSIRMFVVITNYAGAFIYPYGYFNVALHPFEEGNYTDLRSHLTNEHLAAGDANVVQIPSSRFDFFAALYPRIKDIIAGTANGLKQLHPKAFVYDKQRHLAIFGFDFMVDKDRRLWLLEANHGPCFPMGDEHPLQFHLYFDFWQSFISSFVEPIAGHYPLDKIQYSLFESLDN